MGYLIRIFFHDIITIFATKLFKIYKQNFILWRVHIFAICLRLFGLERHSLYNSTNLATINNLAFNIYIESKGTIGEIQEQMGG
jgi:hypothetical protein